MKKRKQVVAYCIVDESKDDRRMVYSAINPTNLPPPRFAQRQVKLVEHDPAVDAVVKAAKALAHAWGERGGYSVEGSDLSRAVERLERKEKR